MPLIILIGMLMYVGIRCALENLGRKKEPFTKAELDELSRLFIGKPPKDCKKILRTFCINN